MLYIYELHLGIGEGTIHTPLPPVFLSIRQTYRRLRLLTETSDIRLTNVLPTYPLSINAYLYMDYFFFLI